LNFAQINESLRIYRQDKKEKDEQNALDLIDRGQNLYGEEFWTNFMNLCGDIDGFSALLGVNPQKIASWRSKIKKHLTKYYNQQDDAPKSKKRKLLRAKDYEEN